MEGQKVWAVEIMVSIGIIMKLGDCRMRCVKGSLKINIRGARFLGETLRGCVSQRVRFEV